LPSATAGEEYMLPKVAKVHAVLFTFGAEDFEYPEWVKSWWNIGHQSIAAF
jgi:hypothetical protein